MSQLDLFGGNALPPPAAKSKTKTPPTVLPLPKPVVPQVPYQKNSPTSKAAADAIREHAPNQREKVFLCILENGTKGRTDEEIATKMNIPLQSVNPRRGELVKLGHIIDSKRVRRTKGGRPASVWIANPNPPEGAGFIYPAPTPVHETEE